MTTPQQIYAEYQELENEYRELASKWQADGFVHTTDNHQMRSRMLEVGKQLDAKLNELNNLLGIRLL